MCARTSLLYFCFITTILVVFLSSFGITLMAVHASSFEECKIRAEILEVVPACMMSTVTQEHREGDNDIALRIKVVTSETIPESYGVCRYKPNDEETIVIAVPSQKDLLFFKKGSQLELKYQRYVGTGPHGVVEDSSWKFIKVIDK